MQKLLARAGCHTVTGVADQPQAVRVRCTRTNTQGPLVFPIGTETLDETAAAAALYAHYYCPECKEMF